MAASYSESDEIVRILRIVALGPFSAGGPPAYNSTFADEIEPFVDGLRLDKMRLGASLDA